MAPFLAANRLNWDDRADIHALDRTGDYGLGHLRQGGCTLSPIEASEIGDIGGSRLLHSQCHIGHDTLSLARRGATVTGLDFSPRAIRHARALAAELSLPATFVEGSVYDMASLVPGPFDIVFSSWGTINWLPRLDAWARNIAAVLVPGGFFYIADQHPTSQVLGFHGNPLTVAFDWRTPPDAPLTDDWPVTYTGDPTPLAHPRAHEWNHPFSEIIGSLLAAGLRLDFLHEHEELAWRAFEIMEETDNQKLLRLPPEHPRLPLSFSLKASRPR
jgi:SAM-dependent methyltransferase